MLKTTVKRNKTPIFKFKNIPYRMREMTGQKQDNSKNEQIQHVHLVMYAV